MHRKRGQLKYIIEQCDKQKVGYYISLKTKFDLIMNLKESSQEIMGVEKWRSGLKAYDVLLETCI